MAKRSVAITVVRSGGFAGLRREWTVSDGPPDAWMPLIEACPWGSVDTDTESRDRFVYVIDVTAPRPRRRATVPESSLTGPWKDLVDRVSAESS